MSAEDLTELASDVGLIDKKGHLKRFYAGIKTGRREADTKQKQQEDSGSKAKKMKIRVLKQQGESW